MCPRTFPSAVNIRELSWAGPYLTPFSCPTVCLLTLDLLLRLPRASPSAYLGREAFLRESISPLLHTSGDQAARIPICSVVRVNVRFIYSKFTFVRLSGENVFQPTDFPLPRSSLLFSTQRAKQTRSQTTSLKDFKSLIVSLTLVCHYPYPLQPLKHVHHQDAFLSCPRCLRRRRGLGPRPVRRNHC